MPGASQWGTRDGEGAEARSLEQVISRMTHALRVRLASTIGAVHGYKLFFVVGIDSLSGDSVLRLQYGRLSKR